MQSQQSITVLAVDDTPTFAELTALSLQREDSHFEAVLVTSANDALDRFTERDINYVLSDYEMPEMSGLSFLEEIRSLDRHIPFILFTGRGSEEVASDAISAGVTDYLQKRVRTDQIALLANRICNSVAQYRTRHERELTVDRMTDALLEVDEEWRVTTVDSRCEAIYDMDANQMLGQDLWNLFPEAVDTDIYDAYHEVMDTRESTSLEENCEALDIWFKAQVYPAPFGGLSIYFRETANQKEYAEPIT